MITLKINYNNIVYYVTLIQRLKYVSSKCFPITLNVQKHKVIVNAIMTKLI